MYKSLMSLSLIHPCIRYKYCILYKYIKSINCPQTFELFSLVKQNRQIDGQYWVQNVNHPVISHNDVSHAVFETHLEIPTSRNL